MPSPKHIVITGSTRGIGYGLAEAFLRFGCAVTISGRSGESTASAVKQLSAKFDTGRVYGVACDVAVSAQVESLWEKASSHFGKVDIWINNAGHSGEMEMAWKHPAEEVHSVIATNILGTIYGSQVAMRGMQTQGHGAIYNMEGMGSDGRKHAGLTYYGTTKYAVHYFTESLAMEAKDTPIITGGLRPGMVATDMIRDRYKDRPDEWERAAKHAIWQAARTGQPFTSEDITAMVGFPDHLGHRANGPNNRIGLLLNKVAKSYGLRRIDMKAAKNPQAHGRLLTVWQGRRTGDGS